MNNPNDELLPYGREWRLVCRLRGNDSEHNVWRPTGVVRGGEGRRFSLHALRRACALGNEVDPLFEFRLQQRHVSIWTDEQPEPPVETVFIDFPMES